MYVSGSAEYAHETQDHENIKKQESSGLSNLAWTARGGDTRLCAK